MNRRDTVLALLVLGTSPLASFAQQQGKVWRIGWLSSRSGSHENEKAFLEEIRRLGYVEGRNLQIEYRWAAGKDERLPDLAAELARLKVDVIVAPATAPVTAAKGATSTIPIVMASAADPLGAGLVASLARPGGNVTGVSLLSNELAGKRIQLLHEILPRATLVGVLVARRSVTAQIFVEQTRAAAQQMGITVVTKNALAPEALEAVFAAMQRERAQALIVQLNPFTSEHRKLIAELAARHRLPAIFEARASVDAGGLLSYGTSLLERSRRAAHYVDKIFKGAKPADLPIEQPTVYELVINLRTAKALGLTIPQSLLVRADEVIQ